MVPIGIALVVIGAIAWGFVPGAVEVDLVAVEHGALRITVDEDGKTRVRERYVVSAPLAGRLRRIRLDEGDVVTRGETLVAVIEPAAPAPLDARSRAEAEARLRAAEAARRRAEAESRRSEAAHDLAASELRRSRELAEEQILSAQELDRAIERERVATEEARSARFALEVTVFETEQAEAALLHARGEGDGSAAFEIHAPVDGRVLRVLRESAAVVTPGTDLVEIGDPTDLEAEIDVLSRDAVRIAKGARVSLEHWGGERPLGGTVRLVEPGAFTKISALGVEEQRVNVIVDLEDPIEERASLGDGYRVEARIVVWEADDVLKVPVGALFRHEGSWAVFLDDGGTARVHEVEIGERGDLEAEVRSGLSAGDRVVLHPSDRVSEGISLTPR